MRSLVLFLLFLFVTTPVSAAEGLFSLPSKHSVPKTADRLVELLEAKGMTVFARINHAAGASKVGISLRPTTLVIFGNPKVGAPLMQCRQSAAIDLPQKALIMEDEEGKVWLSYNDPTYLKARHQIRNCDKVLEKISGALKKFAVGATN